MTLRLKSQLVSSPLLVIMSEAVLCASLTEEALFGIGIKHHSLAASGWL